ncbi:hypothetical protein DSO57_1028718 [Entomophthora muscae]|uniref:Uncharacterized protein n=1 Tax=Entomophthora muscae TaxID=34485 RepID=A0ACC2UAE2_9FUNG|nr:hypothetical protein DSO57_1028718 [Entomophthora muscae]
MEPKFLHKELSMYICTQGQPTEVHYIFSSLPKEAAHKHLTQDDYLAYLNKPMELDQEIIFASLFNNFDVDNHTQPEMEWFPAPTSHISAKVDDYVIEKHNAPFKLSKLQVQMKKVKINIADQIKHDNCIPKQAAPKTSVTTSKAKHKVSLMGYQQPISCGRLHLK